MTFFQILSWLRMGLSLCSDMLSFKFFGVELWLMLAGLFVSSWVVGFIVKGNGVQFSHFQDLILDLDSRSSRSGGSALSGSSKHSHSIHSDSVIVYDYEVL